MPGLAMEAREEEEEENFTVVASSAAKKEIARQGSPRSALSPQSQRSDDSLDLAMDEIVTETSIEQLYNNVCDMHSSSGEESPSRNSFFSFGRESRIDSELRHLVGDFAQSEEAKELVGEENEEPQTKSPIPIPNPRKKKKKKKKAQIDGLSLLRRAKEMLISGEDQIRALEIVRRAISSFEEDENRKLDLVMSLHVSAAIHCGMGSYAEAIAALERSIEAPAIEDGESHALAKFSGCMQLGDTYAAMGQSENSLLLYSAGLEIQRQVLGDSDPRLRETRRYVAEANVQALNFDEAERLCRNSIEIRSPEEEREAVSAAAADRRLLGLICDAKGDFESALEHYAMAAAAMASKSGGGGAAEIAAVDRSSGDAYLALSRYDEAAMSYRKSLAAFRSCLGENHTSTASVLVRLADLHNKVGRFRESKTCCEEALRIYESRKKKPNKPIGPRSDEEEIAGGLVEISMIYQSMNELDRAAKLLKKASRMFWADGPGRAGIEAQLGVIYYMMGKYKESYEALKSSVTKFRAAAEKKSALFGIALNQMGLACVHLCSINEAAELFEEAKDVLEMEYGPHHPDTLGVYSNLAGTYDAMGRLEDAIETLEYVVKVREEKLGTANPEVADEKRRLSELLKEAGRARNRKPMSLETLLHTKKATKLNGIEVL